MSLKVESRRTFGMDTASANTSSRTYARAIDTATSHRFAVDTASTDGTSVSAESVATDGEHNDDMTLDEGADRKWYSDLPANQ